MCIEISFDGGRLFIEGFLGNQKTLQYLMGHSEIGVTLNTYTHLGLEDAVDELKKLEEERAGQEIERGRVTHLDERVTQRMFRVV